MIAAGKDDNLALGNPSHATTDEVNKDNYLLVKAQYAMSYNNSKGMANWVSWHLSTAWMGSADRCNCFNADDALPVGFTVIKSSNYIGTGFDRGHLCPSADRSATPDDNAATFLMTNMSPQSPVLNEQTWEHLEAYCRQLAIQGNELYIIAGAHGTGGIGKKGHADTIANGKINVPSHFYKIVVVLPVGDNDIKRITNSTRVIAVDMPNRYDVNAYDWGHYRCTVDQLEAETGYDFLSAVPVKVQKAIESVKDAGPVN
ncbi:MAG: DNA/RNA non-specific endonuclease [Bacteroidetes bacterium]|nr:DNA/RNA non-specific endonuclease [Bacteroidota bacterium]